MPPNSTQAWHHRGVEPWYDTHVHFDRYAQPEREVLLAHAEGAGVRVIAVGVDIESSRSALALDGMAGRVIGIHPRNATQPVTEIAEIAAKPGVVAIGECGFDKAGPPFELQAQSFCSQADIARHTGLALVLHIDGEGAWAQLTSRDELIAGLRVVRHYFTGDESQARWHAERGHYLSFGNPLRREAALRDVARTYPEHLLLIETDSYPLPGRNTEPAHVARVGETLALVRNWTFEAARATLARNTRVAFNLRG